MGSSDNAKGKQQKPKEVEEKPLADKPKKTSEPKESSDNSLPPAWSGSLDTSIEVSEEYTQMTARVDFNTSTQPKYQTIN